MQLSEMNERLDSEGPFVWCDPWNVKGVDFTVVKACNEKRWFRPLNVEEELEETPDEVIVEFLMYAIISHERLKTPAIDGLRFVKAVLFLVCEAGSSYAANILVAKRELVQEQDARECLALLKGAYSSSTWFIRDILRDFILELFCFGPLWEEEPYGGRFRDLWTEQELAFLHHVFDDGYLTIDKEDASLFVDGTKRW